MRVILIASLICLLTSPAWSAPRTEAEAIRAAETWLAQGKIMPRPNARVSRVVPYRVGDETRAFVLELAGGGYCLSGADDLQLPVHLYVPTGRYDPGDLSVSAYLASLSTRLVELRHILADPKTGAKPDVANLAARVALWRNLSSGRIPPEKSTAGVSPRAIDLSVNSTWDQFSPFFNDCPQLGNYGPTLVGCVAMGMSQIMHYWQWPPTGTGSFNRIFEYRHTDNWHFTTLANDPDIPAGFADRLVWDKGYLKMIGYWDYSSFWRANTIQPNDDPFLAAMTQLFDSLTPYFVDNNVNFATQTYDWSVIGNTHDGSDPVGDQAVAQLCYDVGVSVDMSWGVYESFSNIGLVPPALTNYFRYDHDVTNAVGSYAAIVDEIRWGRPVEISGQRPNGAGGHSFLVCGYDDTTFPASLVINLGGGTGSALSAIDDLAGFTESQSLAMNIAPEGVVRFLGNNTHGDGSPNWPFGNFVSAVSSTPTSGTLIMQADSQFDVGTAPLVLSKPMVLKGAASVVRN